MSRAVRWILLLITLTAMSTGSVAKGELVSFQVAYQHFSGFPQADFNTGTTPQPPFFGYQPPLTFNSTIEENGNTSTAQGGAGYFEDAFQRVITFADGMGVSQNAPNGVDHGSAALEVFFSAQFVVDQAFSDWEAFYHIPLSGSVSGAGSVGYELGFNVNGSQSDTTPIFFTQFQDSYFATEPGSFDVVLSDRKPIPGLNSGEVLDIVGQMWFYAENDEGAASMSAPEGLRLNSTEITTVPEADGPIVLLVAAGLVAATCPIVRRNRTKLRAM